MSRRKMTYFAADVHLGLDVMEPKAREARFVSFLRSVNTADTEAVYLLGDIFDFWYEYRHVVPKGYVQVFAAIQDLIASGVDVYFFQGNHDVWTYSYFEEMGMKRLTQPALVEIGGKKFCMGHGDGLGKVSAGYRILRGIFHNRVLQFFFSMLHPYIAFSLGCGWSRNNRLARHEKYVFKGAAEPLYQFAEAYSREHAVDCFVFGHYHTHVDETLPSGARLIVLEDWLESSPYLYFDGSSGYVGYSQNRE